MNRKGKLDKEMEEATNQGEQQRGGTPKRKETSNTATMPMTMLEQRKRFQPTATRATQPIEKKDFQLVAELIKQRGAAAIDPTTEVVTPVTIEFIVPPQAK
eukprot:3622327-Ditylum_brightwellii.AAC.1